MNDRPRALFVTQHFPPETFAGANRARAFADALAETHELTVVGLHPSYPSPSGFEPDAGARLDATLAFPIRRRFRFTPHRHRSALGRALGEQFAALVLGLRAVVAPADVVVTSSPSMFLGPVALVVARMKRVPFVWDVRDVTWAMASEMADGNRLLGGLPASLLSATMWATARSCDLLVAATPGIARLATEAGASPERIITVENGISEPLRKALTAVRSRNERSRPVVTYVGLLGRAQQLSTLVDVAQRLPDVDFVIVGEGPHRSQIEDQIRRSGCANVRVLGYVPPDRLPDLYGGSDLLFAQVVDSPTLNRTARPSKLLEYMAAGRAMVYAGHGDAVALITEIGCGVGATPGDPEAIAAAMVDLLDDRSRLHDLGRRGAAYVDALPTRHERMQVVADLVRRRFSRSRSIRIALAPKSVS